MTVEYIPLSKKKRYFKGLIYGDPGLGKTKLAVSADNVESMRPVLLVNVEAGDMSVEEEYPDVMSVDVRNFKDMNEVYNNLVRDPSSAKTVIIDSLTELQKLGMYQIMEDVVKKHPDRDPDVPSMREWGKCGESIRKVVRAFRDLPINVIYTCLMVSKQDELSGAVTCHPSLPGKLAAEVPAFLDFVFYMYVHDKNERYILTQPTVKHVGPKDRSGKLATAIPIPDDGNGFKTIMETIQLGDWIEQEKETKK